ncbi:MAG: ATP-binding protein [Clostridiales bacterium]|nr:ATP-binding protein [Clostridiales bacterium]
MLKYFAQKLDTIYDTKRALAKANSQKSNKALLDLHPALSQMMRDKKIAELDLARKKAFNQDTKDEESALANLNKNIADYIKTNNLNFSPSYSCPICKDSGYVDGQPCKCLLKEYNTLLCDYKSVSPMPKFTFEDNTYSNSDNPQKVGINKLYKIMREKVCGNFNACKWQNFIFSGASGIGKTSLAVAVADDLLKRNVSVFYVTSFELINIFLDKHTHKQTALSKFFDYVSECEMLIIDNLGAEPIYKNVTLEYLFSTLEKRLANKKKTIICTQLGGQALINRYGETFISKFADKKHSLSVML